MPPPFLLSQLRDIQIGGCSKQPGLLKRVIPDACLKSWMMLRMIFLFSDFCCHTQKMKDLLKGLSISNIQDVPSYTLRANNQKFKMLMVNIYQNNFGWSDN